LAFLPLPVNHWYRCTEHFNTNDVGEDVHGPKSSHDMAEVAHSCRDRY